MSEPLTRCQWANGNPLMEAYHDTEWGVPVHDDRLLFEMLTLEGAQAGLSWLTVLKKREGYRHAFANFDPVVVSQFTEDDVERLMLDPEIIRNRAKIVSTIGNARALMMVQDEFGSFAQFQRNFFGSPVIDNSPQVLSDLPARTKESDAFSKEFLKRGFKFVGSTICYSYMQAVGLVNDHLSNCFRRDLV